MQPTGRLRPQTMRLVLGQILCLGLSLSIAACHRAGGDGAAGVMVTNDHGLLSVPAGSPMRSHLVTQTIAAADGTTVLTLPAAVEADPARVANILAPLTGRVVALKVALGQHVRRGQVLAVIASGDFAQVTSDEDKARDAAGLARKALDRARGVQAAGGSAAKDLEAAESAHAQAEAELTRARARRLSLNGGGGSRDLVLKSPQDGVVTALAIASGAVVGDPAATLMTVTNIDRVFVTANVAEDDIGKVRPGAGAEIALAAGLHGPSLRGPSLHGKVGEVDAVVQTDTRRQKVRIALPNPGGRLMPGMYATVKLAAPAATGVEVPQSALVMNNDSISVLVEVRPWAFQRRAVRIGDETETTARVLSGLQPGERIVVRGGVLLND